LSAAGTTISALAIGGLLRWAGWGGVIESLSIEEAMSFASLLSATDPVATLAVFQSLKVHPTLYALVYGESVVNDAVAIVLYRTFTSFLVNEITTNAAVYAILSFFGVLFLSVIIGVIFGAIATLSFRYVNVTGQERHVRWERELHAQVDKFKRFIPKMPSLHVDDEEEMAAIESAYQEEKKAEEAAQAAEEQAAETNVAIASSTSFHGAGAGTTTLSKRNVTIKDDSKAVVARMNVPDDADDGAKTMASVDLMSGIAESAILLLFGYVSFAFAESIYLSGIVASLFCGISMSLYTRRILTRDGKVISSAIFKMLANIAETVVFFQIGLTVILTLNIEAFDFGFVTFTLFACLLARALNIFPLSYLLNQYRDDPLPPSFQLALWYSGLRGAIAFVTALGFPTQHRDLIVNTTSWICLFTIFFLGGSTTTALDTLHIPYNVDSDKYYKDKAARDRAIRKAHARALKARMAALSAANTPVAAVEAAKIAKQAEDEDPEAAKLNAADAPVGIELKMSMERRSKEMMRWIDRAIQKVVYGRVFLREMELANAISTLKARRSVLQSLGLPFPANLQKQLEDKERRLQEGDKGKWYDADDDDDDDVFGDDADAFEDDSDDEDSNNNGQSSPRKKKRNQDGSENQLERDRKKKSAHALKNPTRAAARDPMHFMKKYDSADRAALAKVYQVQAEIVAEEEKAKGKKTTVVIPTASPLAEDDPAAAADVGLFGSHHTASATAATTVSNPSPAPPSSTTSSSSASSAAGTGLALSKAVDEWDAAVNAATITQPPPGIVRSPSPAVPASASASAAPAPAPAPAAAPIATVSGNIFGLSDDHAAFIASWGSKLETSSAALTTPSGKSGRNADSATAPVVAEPALAAAVVEIPGWNAPAIAFAAPAPVPSPVPAAAKKPSPVPERASPAPVHPGRGVTLKTTPTTATASAASSFTPDQQPANASASSGPLFTTGATPWRGSGPTPVASPEPVATHQAAPAAAQSQTPAPVHVTPAARTLAANPLFSSPNLPASPAHSVGSVGGSLFLGSPGSTAAASGATGEWSHASGTATGAHNQVPPPPTSSMSSSVSAPASPLLAAARTAAQAVVSSVSGASEDHSAVGNNSGSSGSGAGADDDGEGSGIGSADHSVRASPTAGLLAAAAAATAPSGNVSSGNASRTSVVSAKGGPPTRRPTAAPGAHPPHLPASITSSINDHHHHDDGEDFASLPDAFHYDEDEQTADASAHSGVAGTGAAASRAGSNNRGSIVGGAGRAGSNSRASFIHGPGSGASVGAGAGAGAGGSRSGSALRRPSHQTMLPAPPADSGIGFETEAAPGTSSGTASKPDDPFAF
jgi:NhaP-type Na+/H+ or K+/H+ antiporter